MWTFIDKEENNTPFESQTDDDRVVVWIVTEDCPDEVQYAHYSMHHELYSTMYSTYRNKDVIKWANIEYPSI